MSELIEKIKNHEVLSSYIVYEYWEGTAEVRISDKIIEHIAVNPDKYFKSLKLGSTPASVDYIITTLCKNNSHKHNLIELKSISTTLRGEDAPIYQKFEDTFDKFISEKFIDVYAPKDKRCFKFFLVHNIKRKSELNLLNSLFMQPIKRSIGNFYIDYQKSPFILKKC